MPNYTTDELLNLIKRRAFVPINQDTFTDAEILEMATEEMRSIVVPAILSAREEWYVVVEDITVDSSTTKVAIPSRAIGGSLRELSFVQGDTEYNLPRLSLEDKIYKDSQGPIQSVYLQGNDIYFIGKENGSLRTYYHCRPGALVKTSLAGQISVIDTGTNTVTLTAVPSAWVAGNTVDLIQGKPHFSHKAVNYSIVSITGQDVVLSAIPDNLVVGDWVALEDESPVPQVPLEWFSYVAQACAVQILESLGDSEAAERATARRDKLHKHALQLVTPRIEGETKKAVASKNRGNLGHSYWRR